MCVGTNDTARRRTLTKSCTHAYTHITHARTEERKSNNKPQRASSVACCVVYKYSYMERQLFFVRGRPTTSNRRRSFNVCRFRVAFHRACALNKSVYRASAATASRSGSGTGGRKNQLCVAFFSSSELRVCSVCVMIPLERHKFHKEAIVMNCICVCGVLGPQFSCSTRTHKRTHVLCCDIYVTSDDLTMLLTFLCDAVVLSQGRSHRERVAPPTLAYL